MSLIDGYGVLVGTLHNYFCDDGRDDDQYYHCNIRVETPDGIFRCAVDLDTKKEKDGIHWRTLNLGDTDMYGLVERNAGWHYLKREPESGALDYLRSPELQQTERCERVGNSRHRGEDEGCSPWKYGDSHAAFDDLAGILRRSERLLVFGEPFRVGRGVHNIHQNQGDPADSRWSRENGIWQDGAVAGVDHDNRVRVFLSRFKTQATKTDERGKPLHL